jgi:Protein of unknown function (DUF2599)
VKITIALLAAAAFVAVLAGPAHAQTASFHCQNGRKFRIFTDVSVYGGGSGGGAVAAEYSYEGNNYAVLRSRSNLETFTMECLGNELFAIRTSDGHYVSVETGFTGSDNGMLRARGAYVGPQEIFSFESTSGVTNWYHRGALKSSANNKYVTVYTGYPETDPRYAMLRASSDTFGEREGMTVQWWDAGGEIGVPSGGPCFDSPWMTHATWMYYWSPVTPGDLAYEVSFTPTTAARLNAKTPDQWDDILKDLRNCVYTPNAAWGESVHNSLYKQLACHAVFGVHEELGGPTWDLESHRPDIPWGDVLNPLVNGKCNWGGDSSSSSLIGSLIFRPSLDRFLNSPFNQSQLQPTPSGRRFGQPEIEFQHSGHIFVRSRRLSLRVPPRGLPASFYLRR